MTRLSKRDKETVCAVSGAQKLRSVVSVEIRLLSHLVRKKIYEKARRKTEVHHSYLSRLSILPWQNKIYHTVQLQLIILPYKIPVAMERRLLRFFPRFRNLSCVEVARFPTTSTRKEKVGKLEKQTKFQKKLKIAIDRQRTRTTRSPGFHRLLPSFERPSGSPRWPCGVPWAAGSRPRRRRAETGARPPGSAQGTSPVRRPRRVGEPEATERG